MFHTLIAPSGKLSVCSLKNIETCIEHLVCLIQFHQPSQNCLKAPLLCRQDGVYCPKQEWMDWPSSLTVAKKVKAACRAHRLGLNSMLEWVVHGYGRPVEAECGAVDLSHFSFYTNTMQLPLWLKLFILFHLFS